MEITFKLHRNNFSYYYRKGTMFSSLKFIVRDEEKVEIVYNSFIMANGCNSDSINKE